MNKSILISMCLPLFLSGCGGESSSDSEKVETKATYYADDVLEQTAPTSEHYVDLSDSMRASDGSDVVLTGLVPLNGGCDYISKNTKGFTIDASNVGTCDFSYTIGPYTENTVVEAEAVVRTAVGETTGVLTPISAVTSSSTEVTVDVRYELGLLGVIVPETYSLSTITTLPNQDVTKSSATVDPLEDSITYVPGSGIESGVERILYTYGDGTSVYSGALDVAISESGNSAPIAESAKLTEYTHPETGEQVSEVPNRLTTRIDVAEFIYDMDEDPLHLTDVYAFDASVVIPEDGNADGNLFNDTVFDFTSLEPGETNVTYVVSDGHGGYGTGVLEITVSDVYEYIVIDDVEPHLYFSPPMTVAVAEDAHIEHTPYFGNGLESLSGVSNAGVTWNSADGYCQALDGRLPSIAELERLAITHPNLFEATDWPEDQPYWSSEKDSTSTYSFDFATNGTITNSNEEPHYYSSCISYGPIERIEIVGEQALPVYYDQGSITSYYTVTAYYEGGMVVEDYNGPLNWSDTELPANGLATFDVRTQSITTSPTNPETSGEVMLNACTEDNVCAQQRVALFTQIIQIDESGILETDSCEDIGYKTVGEEFYEKIFNSIYRPTQVASWDYQNVTWNNPQSEGLNADVYGRVEPNTEDFISKAAYINEQGASNYKAGRYEIIKGTGSGPNHLICQVN